MSLVASVLGCIPFMMINPDDQQHSVPQAERLTPPAKSTPGNTEPEASFRLLFMNNPQPMWVYDVNTLEFLEVNDAAVAHYGYSRDQFLSMRITDIRTREDVSRLLEAVEKKHTGLEHAGQWRHRLSSGQLIDVEMRAHSLVFADHSAELVVAYDVTERKRAEQESSAREAQYRRLVENIPEVVWQADEQGNVLFVSERVASVFGYSSQEILRNGATLWFGRMHPDDRERVQLAYEALFQKNQPFSIEYRMQHRDGHWMWWHDRAITTGEENGRRYADGLLSDITERKQLEEQLLHSQKMETIGQLAGGVAHDFNNAIGVMVGYSTLLKERLLADKTSLGYAEQITEAGYRAASLTRQLLAFSRKQIVQPTILDLNAVISDTEKMLRRVIGENIRINVLLHGSLGRIKADSGQIQQVLINLALKARDAMPSGGQLTIKTENVAFTEASAPQALSALTPGSYVVLSMTDTGRGMDEEEQTRVFEPFFATKGPGLSSGLGLSAVHAIVEQSGAQVAVHSALGKGTQFEIYFPRMETPDQPATQPSDGSGISAEPETILLVEDEEPMRVLTGTCLASGGYKVLDAENGETAINLAREYKSRIHLLLTDVLMPGMSGRELAESLTLLHPEMKVLYMSGYTADHVAQDGILGSRVSLLEKPFSKQALLGKVREALGSDTLAKCAGQG